MRFAGRGFVLNLLIALMALVAISAMWVEPTLAQDNRRLVYSGRILKPDGSPVSGNVNFALSIISPNGCIMWNEAQTVNMTGTSGTFSIELGNPTNKTASATGVSNINDTFKNYGTFTGMAAMPSTGCVGTYSPSTYDDRTLYVSFNDGSGAQTINVPIKSEPFAFQAQNANGIFGYSLTGTPSTGQFLMFDGTNWVSQTISSGGILTLGGQSGAAQTFAIGTGGTAPAWSSASNTHTLNIPMAATAGVTAGLLSKSDYDTFNTKLGTSLTNAQLWLGNGSNVATAVSLSGDATVTNAGVVTVAKVQNRTVATTAPTNGQVLTWNNGLTQWEPQTLAAAPVSSVAGKTGAVVLNIADVKSTVGGGAFLTGAGCSAGQALTYSSVTDTVSCTSVTPSVANSSTLSNGKIWIGDGSSKAQEQTLSGDATISNTGVVTLAGLDTSKITTGTLAAARMPALTGDVTTSAGSTATTIAAGAVTAAKLGSDVGAWSVTGSDVYRSSGNIGIGTNNPTYKLSVIGGMRWGDTSSNYVISQNGYIEYVGAAGSDKFRIQTSKSGDTTNYSQAFVDPTNGFSFMSNGTANGNVGIGTTGPTALLQVHSTSGDGAPNKLFSLGSNSTTNSVSMNIVNDDTAGSETGWKFRSATVANGATGNDLWINSLSAGSGTTRVAILNSNGNVGIGTTSPGQKLSVAGTIESTSGGVKFPDGTTQTTAAPSALPAGVLMPYAGSSAPSGYLLCDGSAVSRTTYAALFTAIGTTYGAGDGSTTFNLPDLRGRVPVGAGQGSGLTNRALASTGGEETHTLTGYEIPSHNHAIRTGSNPHAIDITSINFNGYNAAPNTPPPLYTGAGAVYNDPPLTTGMVSSNFGGGQAHNVMQPYVVLNYIIKY